MFLGYNTNGFAHHSLFDAFDVLQQLGYRGVALTPDVHHLNPFDRSAFAKSLESTRRFLGSHNLSCVVETGSRFLLNPWTKHQPTLLSTEPDHRDVRFAFLQECIDIAAGLSADGLSFWSGAADVNTAPGILMDRLVEGCKRLADISAERNVRLAFEPEPGMFIDTMEKFAELHAKVNHPAFGLTIDIGHLVCNGELPVSEHLRIWQDVLWNVHIEDMKAGVHDHVMFGEGEVDFVDVFAGLREIGYAGGVYVELSRHSHDAVNTARKAKAFLDRFV
jgi:L-ribulose-5-phosphate 3-epimerase